MCTVAGRYSQDRCVSRWRPAEVDGLQLGRFRLRSAILGTRSVMESLAAPSVEAMTPSTPLLPPLPPVPPNNPHFTAWRSPTSTTRSLSLPALVDYSSPNTRGRHDRASSAPALTVFLRRASRPLSDQDRICNRLTCTRLRHCLRASTKTNPRIACYYIAVRLIFRFPREITMTRLLQEKNDGTAWIVDNDDELVISSCQGMANSVRGYDTG